MPLKTPKMGGIFWSISSSEPFMPSSYFDQVSPNYLESCQTGLHGFFKSQENKRLNATLLTYYSESFAGKVLDVGCGPGFYTRALQKTYKNLQKLPSETDIHYYAKL